MTARVAALPDVMVCESCQQAHSRADWAVAHNRCPKCLCEVYRRETDVERRLREAEKQIARLESRPRGGGRWPILLRYGVPL